MHAQLLSVLALLLSSIGGASNAATEQTSVSIRFEDESGVCSADIGVFCLACAASFANAIGKSVKGDSTLVSVWPSLTHAEWALNQYDDVRLVFPSLRLEHSDGTAYGFGECGIDAKAMLIRSARIWFRSDVQQVQSSLPISSNPVPKHLKNITVGPSRLLGIIADPDELATIKTE